MAIQMMSRSQVSHGKKAIITAQVRIPMMGTKGTHGVLKARGASGIECRIIHTPPHTITKANRVPMLVISPTTLIGTRAANKLTKIQKRIFDFQGVR